eukprot:CAMPEP_0179025630 /NCGR_PEP_ID=MMETSP0796-20121207/8089_1 /TAXON_ID=73915 /ORGANISM="Pyrodinium bahamense, Strain pbaha01" /LENGTH=208 /DNA_ID=CAMNT_0020721667 /DNA_START=51 /DNA_END=677 /DNA_ORIENTATION=+
MEAGAQDSTGLSPAQQLIENLKSYKHFLAVSVLEYQHAADMLRRELASAETQGSIFEEELAVLTPYYKKACDHEALPGEPRAQTWSADCGEINAAFTIQATTTVRTVAGETRLGDMGIMHSNEQQGIPCCLQQLTPHPDALPLPKFLMENQEDWLVQHVGVASRSSSDHHGQIVDACSTADDPSLHWLRRGDHPDLQRADKCYRLLHF